MVHGSMNEMGYIARRARILYNEEFTSRGLDIHPLIEGWEMLVSGANFFAPSPLGKLCRDELEAVKKGTNFFPGEHVGTPLLSAYEVTNAYADLAVQASFAMYQVKFDSDPFSTILNLKLEQSIAEDMYKRCVAEGKFNPDDSSLWPLKPVRTYAFSQNAEAYIQLFDRLSDEERDMVHASYGRFN